MTETKHPSHGIISFTTLVLVLLLMAACTAKPPENSRAAQANRGRAHYQEHCIGCHGADGKGMVIDSLQVMSADLTRIVASRKNKEFPIKEIARIIDGRDFVRHQKTRAMPIWGEEFKVEGDADENQLRGKLGEIIAYLMSIQGT